MTRSHHPFSSFGGFVAFVVALLHVTGALHYTLVQHGYSAALGGVVHVHAAASRAQSRAKLAERATGQPELVAATLACAPDLCPVADAAHGAACRFALLVTGSVDFGEARLLAEPDALAHESWPVVLSAPKTSPPG